MSTFNQAIENLEKACKIANISLDTETILKTPQKSLEVAVPIKMDDGSLRVFKGYRCRYNNSRGPCKGGLRFHPDVCMDEVKSLAFWMTIKTAVAGIPYGGGKGGISVNPKELSEQELERLSRSFIKEIAHFIGPETDIPAPDVYTNPKIMAWMNDEYNKITGRFEPGVITGKPIENHGSLGRGSATGRGGYICIKELGFNEKKTTVAIHGFGNAGQWCARLLDSDKFKVVAISDSRGCVIDPNGLNIKEVIKDKEQGKLNYTSSDSDSVMYLDVDILIPAALENCITKDNVNQVQARYIVELANGPITPEADEILDNREVVIIPDVLANAGGVVVSYLEWVQNRQGFYWDEDEVNDKMEEIMEKEFARILDVSKEFNCSIRMASYIHALKRIEMSILP